MKKSVVFFAVFSIILGTSLAQDQVFLNTNQTLLYLNPSFAGSNGSVRDQFAYRNLWPSLSGNNISFYNGLDAYVKALHGGLALSTMMTNQSHGDFHSSELNLIYAPHFECKETGFKLIPSIQLSYLKRSVDVSSLTFSQLAGYTAPPLNGKKNNFDASAGLLFNYKNFYAGGTVFHINQPDVGVLGVSKLPSRLSFNASYNLVLNEKTLINFAAVYTRQQKYNGYQVAVNAILLKYIVAGIGLADSEAPFINLGYRNKYFSVMTGYDFTFSRLAGNTAGSWQLALGLRLYKKASSEMPDTFEKW